MLQNMFYIPGEYWSRGFNSLELQHSQWNITSYNFLALSFATFCVYQTDSVWPKPKINNIKISP